MADTNTEKVSCDTCGHTDRLNHETGELSRGDAAHEATAGTTTDTWGDSHIMWPTR